MTGGHESDAGSAVAPDRVGDLVRQPTEARHRAELVELERDQLTRRRRSLTPSFSKGFHRYPYLTPSLSPEGGVGL